MTERVRTTKVPSVRVITVNKIKCNSCGNIIESKYRHDFKMCACGTVSVDGGTFYLKRSFTFPTDYTELSEYKDV